MKAQVKADSNSGVNWEEGKKRDTWGNPFQNSGCLLRLVELIPRQPNKLSIKKSSVGEPLAKFRLLSLVVMPLLDCLRRPKADLNKERARWGNPLQNSGCSLQ